MEQDLYKSPQLIDFIRQKKLLVMLGPGGVGKTTSSIAVAILAAANGLRVGILSIDPAKRLAAALGMPLGHRLLPITFDFAQNFRGSLAGAMLDQKAVFDSMVTRFAKDPAVAARIFANRLYQAVSGRFAGAIEYMALARVQEMLDSKDYDLIVLDTPPDTHALDFLSKPNILSNFGENKVMAWLIKPFHLASKLGVEKLFSAGERLMGGIAKVTGIKALSMVSEFMLLMQDVVDGFQTSGERVKASLADPSTAFFLVSVGGERGAKSALNLSDKLKMIGHSFDAVLVNRCLPIGVGEECLKENAEHDPRVAEILRNLRSRFQAERYFLNFLQNEIAERNLKVPLLCPIEEQEYALEDKESLYKLSQTLA